MRVAAVAFVLIVGAAVVLAFANTLNSWVLGGLLGGLAAILLCIPISLAIFTFLAHRHESRQRTATQDLELTEEVAIADEMYEDEEQKVLAADDPFFDPRGQYSTTNRRAPISGYLPLPPAEQDLDLYEDTDGALLARRDPRNYPRQPRFPARSLAPEESSSLLPSPVPGAVRRPATRSLAQHQSAALRKARQEAQQQARRRGASDSLVRRAQGESSSASRRPRTSHSLRPRERSTNFYQPEDEYNTRQSRQPLSRTGWHEDDDVSDGYATEELREHVQQYPRHPAYPRRPRNLRPRATERWTGELSAEDEPEEGAHSRRSRRDPERLSGNLRNPLVRRAPYLYEDDPLNEEFARQLDNDRPITRRSSLYEQYRDDEED